MSKFTLEDAKAFKKGWIKLEFYETDGYYGTGCMLIVKKKYKGMSSAIADLDRVETSYFPKLSKVEDKLKNILKKHKKLKKLKKMIEKGEI